MKVLIVEDEVMAQKNLMRSLTQNFPDIEIVGTSDSVKGTVNWLKDPDNQVDVIFMDVELADGEGFEIFRQCDIKAKVVMTTAYDNYAIKAFEACVSEIEENASGIYMTEISGPTIPMPVFPKLGYKLVPLGKNWSYGVAALIFAAIEYKKLLESSAE